MPSKISGFIRLIRSLIFYTGYVLLVIALGFYAMLINLACFSDEKNYRLLIGFSKIMIGWARIACGIRYDIVGLENIPTEPCVIISNHQSVWETYFFNILFSPLTSVVKTELIKIPFFGRALRMISPIDIDRTKPSLSLKKLINEGKQRLSQGNWVLIFPEGTRVKKDEMVEFNVGGVMLAIKADKDILPIAHNAGNFWPSGELLKSSGTIKVVIGQAISTKDKTRKDLLIETENWIRSAVAELN